MKGETRPVGELFLASKWLDELENDIGVKRSVASHVTRRLDWYLPMVWGKAARVLITDAVTVRFRGLTSNSNRNRVQMCCFGDWGGGGG